MRKQYTHPILTALCGLLLLLGAHGLQAQSCALACNNQVNISLPGTDAGCQVEVTYDMVSEDTDSSCPGTKIVTVMTVNDVVIPGSPFVDDSHIGMTLKYRVTHPATGNNCWGFLLIEDKQGPTFSGCTDAMVFCTTNTDPTIDGGDLPTPTIDDCSGFAGPAALSYADQVQTFDCPTAGPAAIITRTWNAVDVNGMVSSCQQTITVEGVSLATATPICPAPVTLECSADPSASAPAQTGYPTIEVAPGQFEPIIPGEASFCSLASSFSDEEFSLCGGGTKILRTWTVFDWCLPTNSPDNSWTCIQVIKLEDSTAPTLAGPADFTIAATSNSCGASFTLPQPGFLSDDCSDVTVNVQTPVGLRTPGEVISLDGGSFNLIYTATDGCNNSSTDLVVVTIVDNVAPVPVCDEITTVSLSDDGTAVVAASVFDDGSTDNCGVDRFEARRLANGCGPATAFDEFVSFSCCDLSETVMIRLRVYDAAGNFNDCTVEVNVQDAIPAQLLCPTDKTAFCTQDFSDLSVFGEVAVIDECGADVVESVSMQLDDCGLGFIFRTFTATDQAGLSNSCTQTIEVINPNPFDGPESWPADITLTDCGNGTDPDDLPTSPINYSRPVIVDGECDNIAVTSNDLVLTTGPSCLKILRTWTIIDWCQYDVNNPNGPGRYEYTQTIKVEDNDAPILSCPADVTIDGIAGDCSTEPVTLPPLSFTDCNPDASITFALDYGVDGSTDLFGQGADASGDFPYGATRVRYTVEDGCGNVSLCDFIVFVRDAKKPSPVCMNGIAVELMPMNDGGMIELTPQMFDNGSFDNCTPSADLTLSITPSVFTCADVGTQPVTLFATDAAGNTDFCETYVIIQDNMVVCTGSPMLLAVSGAVETESMDGVTDVEVLVSGNGTQTAPDMTGNSGIYGFDILEAGYDYTIRPRRNDDHGNGVSSLDIIHLRAHILGLQPLDSPYKLIAADVNNSESISSLDIIALRRVILDLDPEFPMVDSWRFVRRDYAFSDPSDPWADNFPEVYNLNNLAGDMQDADFVAIKMGDLNGSAVTNAQSTGASDRSGAAVRLQIEDRPVRRGNTLTVPVRIETLEELAGLQFALRFDGLELLDFSSTLPGTSDANFHLQDELLKMSWDRTEPTEGTDELFVLTLRADRDGFLRQFLTLDAATLHSEAYAEGTLDLRDLQLSFGGSEAPEESFKLYQNIPNPFRNSTMIGFQLPTPATATLTVYDAAGKVVFTQTQDYPEGYQSVVIEQEKLGTGGVYFYTLETAAGSATRQMILSF